MPQTASRKSSARGKAGGRAASKPASAVRATKGRSAKAAPPRTRGGTSGRNGSGPAEKAKELIPSMGHSSPVRTLARHVAKRAVQRIADGAWDDAADMARTVAERAVVAARQAVEQLNADRLPIQCAVDVAVPLRVAWDEWMTFECLPEGVHTVRDVERNGNELAGSGRGGARWRAEIIDERPRESLAWRSFKGADCAGLITFHSLSDRLTRLELNLDVLPMSGAEMVALSTRLADRRAERDLRRFKARVELINPDVYKEA